MLICYFWGWIGRCSQFANDGVLCALRLLRGRIVVVPLRAFDAARGIFCCGTLDHLLDVAFDAEKRTLRTYANRCVAS